MIGPGRSPAALLAVLGLALLAVSALPAEAPADPDQADQAAAAVDPALSPRHQRWLEDVALLLSATEREVFLSLGEGYQRDHFIRRFWRVRDPFPQTGRNELRESWQLRVAEARERFDGDLGGERARLLLTLGVPSGVAHYTCSLLRPLEVWVYADGSQPIPGAFTLVFVGNQARGRGVHRLWYPSEGLRPLVSLGFFGGSTNDGAIADAIAEACPRSDGILAGLSQSPDLADAHDRLLPPSPGDEWALAVRDRSTEVADDAEPLSAALRLSYPGRHQSRTVVQGLVAVPRDGAQAVSRGAYRGYRFVVDGEVLRQGELFDQFRYRFDLPLAEVAAAGEIPLVVQRYLRPGAYTLIVKVEDVASQRVFRDERTIEVPRVSGRRAVAADGAPVPASLVQAAAEDAVEDRLAEANASIATGEHTIQLLRPPSVLCVGKLRVSARAQGPGIARVAFELNGRGVMRKSRPPYSVELDLGPQPRLHTVRAFALDADDQVLASDEVVINAGPHRFALRLIEPQPGRRYRRSLRVHAEVEVPEHERLDRVELFLDETRLATLYQPPFEQPVLIPDDGAMRYVRAVAYLADGNTAEDVVFVNAPDFVDHVDIRFVELYTTVLDRKNNVVEDLTADDFLVREDGEPQTVRRFELVRDLPIHAGMVIDTSLSMVEELRAVEQAAYRFLETVITARDRAAIITFNDAPTLRVRFTNDKTVLAGGLAELNAEGETALYDSIIFALHYFSGLPGKRAIVVLTDGEDSNSRYRYEDTVAFARHTGVALYIIGLNLPTRNTEVRMRMRRLAHETGGEFFTIERATQLVRVYDRVQQELRAQYLLAYQSPQTGGDAFRRIEVEMRTKGLEAKTISGYFP